MLASSWQDRAEERAATDADPGPTLPPLCPSGWPTRGVSGSCPVLRERDGGEGLTLGAPIAGGGMGIVHQGQQGSMRRPVAIKTARPERGGGAEAALLREARATGALEHPNIVPIYTIGRDTEGRPLIVMKQIQGICWRDLLLDPGHPLLPRGARERLRWHLEILVQVCNAVRFAHSRGVVHRDIKPENVMVGEFGEVYLLDWGLAGALDERGRRLGLPPADEVQDVVGTPGYMAPEMTDPDLAPIDARTDIYLLGALLHELLTGRVRHEGRSVYARIASSHRSTPFDYDASVPPELARVANRATRRDQALRHPSVKAFQEDIARALRHEASRELSDEADLRLRALVRLLCGAGAPVGLSPAVVHGAFIECRFGYQQALRIWEDNPRARRGLRKALHLVARHEIRAGNHDAAAALIEEIADPDPALLRRFEALRRRREAERARVARLERNRRAHDARLGQRKRALLMALMALGWLVDNLVWASLAQLGLFSAGYGTYLLVNVAFALGLGAAVYRLRAVFTQTVSNRRLVWVAFTTMGLLAVHWTADWASGAPFARSVIQIDLLLGAVLLLVAIGIDRRTLAGSLIFFATYGLGVLVPGHELVISGVGGAAAFGLIAWVWRAEEESSREVGLAGQAAAAGCSPESCTSSCTWRIPPAVRDLLGDRA